VHQAVDRIQRRLDDDEMSLGLLAERAGVSPFHFHRVFSSVVGEAPAGYMRRLRLERAAIRLKYTRRSVTEIAFDAGYETHESFTRAFKARFGHAPRRFRAEEACSDVAPEDPIRIVDLQPRRIACLRYIGPYQEVGGAFNAVLEWAGRLGLLENPRIVAVYWDHQAITPPERTRCDVGFFVENAEVRGPDRDGIEVRELPGGEHAVMTCEGSTLERRRRYDFLYGQWLPERGRRPDENPPYEEYVPPGGDLSRLDEVTNVHVRLEPGRAF
jgi:AraC family transcriptional regulator